MKAPALERDADEWRERTANDQLKDRWNRYLARAMIVAVVIHSVAFGLWPSWERDNSLSDPFVESPEMEWITLLQAPENRGGGLPAALPLSDLSDSLAVEPDVQERVQGREAEMDGLSDAMRERLLNGSSQLARIATRDPEPPELEPDVDATGDDSTTIEGRASTAELLSSLDSDAPDLGRLAEIRPELALVAPSAWVLIRNPRDVERFIRRTYRQGRLSRDVSGSVSVTLWIDERGSVEWAEVSESSGRNDLDEVALDLFSEVVAFRPARDEGVPVSRSVVFSLQFPWF